MPKITSREKENKDELKNAPQKCVQNILAYSKAMRMEKLSSGKTIRIVLN